MVEIAPLTVAGIDLATGTTPRAGHVDGKPVTLANAASQVRLSLRARDSALLAGALGRALPDRIGSHADGVARLGPDEWYALLPEGTPVPDAGGQPVSVVDVSSRAVGFTVIGPGAVAALTRGCPLDLAQFTPGRATRTLFETVEIQIWTLAPDEFHIEVWRSFAPWLWHAIAEGIV
ncbi:sarcosine oxidase subunit gamma [Novosphingobium sp.]|uniref:sarcosine oxidase subunit gamma n=1 Tax=Novosphingobium sp. TaxID=1874826 RepID=UPI003D0BE733